MNVSDAPADPSKRATVGLAKLVFAFRELALAGDEEDDLPQVERSRKQDEMRRVERGTEVRLVVLLQRCRI